MTEPLSNMEIIGAVENRLARVQALMELHDELAVRIRQLLEDCEALRQGFNTGRANG